MSTITTADGTQIYYNDWGSGRPIVFSHGWPLSSDAWEDAMFFLAANGFRCIAADRRGHGRSSQPWGGNDIDTYADDLATLTGAALLLSTAAFAATAVAPPATEDQSTVQGVIVTGKPPCVAVTS